MIKIPLTNIPNQSLNIVLDGNNYVIRIHACGDSTISASVASLRTLGNGILAVDIIRNDVVIVTGMRAVSGTPLIPYTYLEDGNFIFITQNDQYPNWRLLGINQFLLFASQAELDALRNG